MIKYEKGTFVTVPNIDIVTWLTPIAQTLYMHLCKRANQDWKCFPGNKILSEDVWVSISSIKKHCKTLVDLWVLKKMRRFKNNEEISPEYEIIIGRSWDTLPPWNDENKEWWNGLNKTKNKEGEWEKMTPQSWDTSPQSWNTPPQSWGDWPQSSENWPQSWGAYGTKSTELNPLTKTNNNNNTEVLEDKSSLRFFWDSFINEILEAIKNNHDGIIDWTNIENRRYGKLLRDKIKKLENFDWNYTKFIDYIIKNTDEFQISNTASPKKLYYNLTSLLAKIKARSNKKWEFERDVLGSGEVDFLWEIWKNLGNNEI